MNKCCFAENIAKFKPDGVNELDPCEYETWEIWRNVTVIVNRCPKCGHVEISWQKQHDTEQVPEDEWEDII